MSVGAGTRLGPYEILEPLGAGGMGEVYRAHDTRLDRTVAIKVLPADVSADPGRRARFDREARTIAGLDHPHICTLYDLGREVPSDVPAEDGEQKTARPLDFLVMEYLAGESLATRLQKGALPLEPALKIATEIAQALAAAHRQGIVHRDLKPGNVMLTKTGAKLLDFGLAKLKAPVSEVVAAASVATQAPTTEAGTLLGTVPYMAPEQLEGQEADARTDLFAFGCVLYEMVTGRRAFDAASQASLIASILKDTPRPMQDLQPLAPAALDWIVRRCLEKDPDERWQSAQDVVHELGWIAEAGSRAAAAALTGRPRRGRLAWLAAALLGAAAGAGIAVAVMMRQAGPPIPSFTVKTFQQHPIFNARFAPDGQSIVFSAAPEGNTPELFSVRPEYIAPRPLGLRSVHLLALSSTGELAVLTGARHIAHCVFTGTLARLPLGAEAPREVVENVRDADWLPDGSGLAIIREGGGKDRLEYPIGKVLFESGGGYLSDLRFSPRGDRIAFFDHPSRWDDRGSVKTVDLAGRVTDLSSGYAAEEGLAWSPDGKEIYFSGTDNSVGGSLRSSVFAITLVGTRRIAQAGAGALRILDVARGGRWLVARDELRLGIMARPPGAGTERDLSWLDGSGFPTLSPDGRTMLFCEYGGEHNVNDLVCLRGTDGSPVVQLGQGFPERVSPDGRWALAVVPTPPMQPVLYPTGAGDPVKLERGRIVVYQLGASWLPDGRRIVLCGIEPGRGPRVYLQDIPGGTPQPITPEGTHLGALSPDGKMVLARSKDGSWAIYPVEGGAPRPVPGLLAREEIVRWSTDGRSVYVFDPREIPSRVERFTLATGRRDFAMLLGTENRTGLTRVTWVSMADDPRVYAYSCYRQLSSLFVVDGAR